MIAHEARHLEIKPLNKDLSHEIFIGANLWDHTKGAQPFKKLHYSFLELKSEMKKC